MPRVMCEYMLGMRDTLVAVREKAPPGACSCLDTLADEEQGR